MRLRDWDGLARETRKVEPPLDDTELAILVELGLRSEQPQNLVAGGRERVLRHFPSRFCPSAGRRWFDMLVLQNMLVLQYKLLVLKKISLFGESTGCAWQASGIFLLVQET
jgi:hypothetical protein